MHLVGHRGAPRVAPGNTMASFWAAHETGCDWVECDCRVSADGLVVMAHDPSVRDREGRNWPIAEHAAADLARLDLGAGEGVPTLEALIAWAAGLVGVMADVKVEGLEAQIGGALSALAPARCIVSGVGDAGRARFRSLFPGLPLSWTVSAPFEAELERRLLLVDTEAVTLEHVLVTPERVRALHGRGVRVYAWTVDDLDRLRELAAMGVDGLISNRADLLTRL